MKKNWWPSAHLPDASLRRAEHLQRQHASMQRRAPYLLLCTATLAAGYSIYNTHSQQASDRAQMYEGVLRDIEREKARLEQQGKQNIKQQSQPSGGQPPTSGQ